MMKEIKRLHALGFAVHLLKAKSKAPIESKWSSGERKSIIQLKQSYRPGMNIGVRLGAASKIGKRFLAVIDCDVKSREKKHLDELEDKLFKLFGEKLAGAPMVASGRGNGSKHIYILTAAPVSPQRLSQASEKVKVHMPSVKASKSDIERLSTLDIKNGMRMRAAWEISLMGEGQQVVLPPSIHPDSGKHYIWSRPFLRAGDAPLIKIGVDLAPKAERESVVADWKPVEVMLDLEDISPRVKKMIVSGEGVDDNSAALFTAALAMCSAGMSDDAILSVLTDRDNYLGACAYSHTQSKSRLKAANWVKNYTLKKARGETSMASRFAEEVEEVPLTEEEARAQENEMIEENGFYIVGKRGGLTPDYNLLLEKFREEKPYKTIADMKAVYAFNGTHYEEFNMIEIKGYAERKFDPPPEDKIRTEFFNKVLANNIARRAFFTESTEGRFNFKNGVLDLKDESKTLRAHSAEFGFRGVLPYEYDPEAKCPEFYKWLFDIMLKDRDLVRILQEFMGYIVRGGDYTFHKALWLGGSGRNGKSTFVDILKALIGHGNYSVLSIKSLVGDKFASSDLDGKIANFSEETSPEELKDSGPFKNLTGNGDIIAQKKYGDIYSFRNRAKLVMTYNQIPELKDLSTGMLSRPLIVPFEKTIEEVDQDRNIQKRFLAELPGIFNFALRGWKRLEAQGDFTRSERSAKALTRVKEDSCNVYQWVQNDIEFVAHEGLDDETTRRPVEMYDKYREREKHSYRATEFYRRLNAHPKIKLAHRHTRDGKRYFGVKFRD